MGTKADEVEVFRRHAENDIRTKWQRVAASRTLGWGFPLDGVATRYSFVREQVRDIRGAVTPDFPVFIYQSRQSPPSEMEIAIAYMGPNGSPFTTRLVTATPQPDEHVALLGAFSAALWVVIAQRMLPDPGTKAFANALTKWTGPSLLSLEST